MPGQPQRTQAVVLRFGLAALVSDSLVNQLWYLTFVSGPGSSVQRTMFTMRTFSPLSFHTLARYTKYTHFAPSSSNR